MVRGITITRTHNSKSYLANEEQKVTRIEVESELYDFDTIYQDVTLDTAYNQWQKEVLTKTLKEVA